MAARRAGAARGELDRNWERERHVWEREKSEAEVVSFMLINLKKSLACKYTAPSLRRGDHFEFDS